MSALERLRELVVPPASPRSSEPSIEAWGRSLELPADYAALLAVYGSGAFRQHYAEISVFSLGNPQPVYDIVESTREFAELLAEIYPDLEDDWLPHPFWPKERGLLQWGRAEIERLFWLTGGAPEHWPVVVVRDTEQIYERLDMTATELIVGLVAGPSPTSLKSAFTGSEATFSRSPMRVGDGYDD